MTHNCPKTGRTVPTLGHQSRRIEITTSLRIEIVTNICTLLSRIIRATADFYVTSLINGPIQSVDRPFIGEINYNIWQRLFEKFSKSRTKVYRKCIAMTKAC